MDSVRRSRTNILTFVGDCCHFVENLEYARREAHKNEFREIDRKGIKEQKVLSQVDVFLGIPREKGRKQAASDKWVLLGNSWREFCSHLVLCTLHNLRSSLSVEQKREMPSTKSLNLENCVSTNIPNVILGVTYWATPKITFLTACFKLPQSIKPLHPN